MPLFAAKGMAAAGGGGNFYTIYEAKRDTADNSSYRQPSGMFDVATSSSGEVYTLNGERNVLTGLYNAVIAKIGAIGAVSWQYTISSAKNCYPCALACDTTDNSIFVVVAETTNESGANNYNQKRASYANAGWNDSTNDVVYHFCKFSSSGTRQWENIWTTSNAASYPSGINGINSSSNPLQMGIFENRNYNTSNSWRMFHGAPDLKLLSTFNYDGYGFVSNSSGYPYIGGYGAINEGTNGQIYGDTHVTLGVDHTGEKISEASSLDGPLFGGRPQVTSNIALDIPNNQFYILVAGNASAQDMSLSRSTMQVLKIPFSGVSIEAKEIVYPGGWDQNAHITLSQSGDLIVPWTGTCKEHTYKDTNSVGSDYFLYDTGDNGAHVDTQNTGAYLTFDWDNDEYDLTYYSQNGIAPPKICKVESEPEAEGTLYQYVSTGGLTPDPTRAFANSGTSTRDNSNATGRSLLSRYTNFVGLHKKNVASNAIDWARTFFAVPNAAVRDMNSGMNWGGTNSYTTPAGGADISVSDSKVFVNGIYFVGNVVLSNRGPGTTTTSPWNNENSYFGFIAKVNFDGSIDYIREVRAIKNEDISGTGSGTKPKYKYEPMDDGGVLLDSINFDAFNNMIISGRRVGDDLVGSTGNYIDNVIFKFPHNGDLIGPIVIDDQYNEIRRRFTYTPATTVKCWEDCIVDRNIQNTNTNEKYKFLRCCTTWNTRQDQSDDPSTLAGVTTQNNYIAYASSSPRLVTLDTGTYATRFLWQAPQTNLQLDPTGNRAWDRADRRSSSSIFLQTFEETDADSRIEAVRSCPAYLYVDPSQTDNAKNDFDIPSFTKSIGQGDATNDIQEISGQEHPNGIVTISQYWDGDAGLRKQLLTRHSPTGGVESRIYHTGYNTYPKDVCIDEVGNIYTVGWTADTTNSNTFGCGYITCYNKDMVFQWDYQYVNADATSLGTAPANMQLHACAVTLDGANTAKLFLGGHYTAINSGTSSQMATISVMPLSITGSGNSAPVGITLTGQNYGIGGGQSGNTVDGIFALDVIQSNATDGGRLYVAYAGNTYDTTGNTTRGMYGVVRYNGSTRNTGAADNWAYIIGDDLQLSTVAFCKGVDAYQRETNNGIFGLKIAVGGKETQAGKTNGVVISATLRADNDVKVHNGKPLGFTAFVVNNSSGADTVTDVRWGHAETAGIQNYTGVTGGARTDHRVSAMNPDHQEAMYSIYNKGTYEDRLFVSCSITNQFTQLDTYLLEIGTANYVKTYSGSYSGDQPEGANILRSCKISTSGITQPSGIVALGPNYGTVMSSMTCAHIGTPNDRQLLTVKLPFDFSKKSSIAQEVGTQFITYDDSDFSLSITGKAIFSAEFDQFSQTSYYDGTRFFFGGASANGSWTSYGGTNVPDVSNEGTFNVLSKDLQAYKQS